MMKKKDDNWKMCVNYRKLNELGGMNYFSKLDLRSGYHQIRTEPTDVHKTAFQTHKGLFEFQVMSFGLINAPATFHSLMNSVFKLYLRKFVIVFFDDILVYSKDLEHHIHHLRIMFQTLADNELFVKRSKCSFGVNQVE
jgi:Reverse transcriptase (RNA-dependent DNA polymerase)